MTYAQQLINLHYVWLDRQVVTLHLCLPIKNKPKRKMKTNNNIYTK